MCILPQLTTQSTRRLHFFSKADWKTIHAEASDLSTNILEGKKNGDDTCLLWNSFKSSLADIINRNVPSKVAKKRKSLPWFSHQLKRMVRRKARLYKKAKSSNQWDKFKDFQRKCKKAFRTAEEEHVNSSIIKGLDNNNSKPFWRYVKAKRQDRTGIPPLKQNGSLVHDSKDKAQILVSQFESVFKKANNDLPPTKSCQHEIESLTITVEGVEKLLAGINISKAVGPDNIPNIVLKECSKELAPGLTAIFQLSVSTGTLPPDWVNANITPVFKKGDVHSAENYRPVSLTSVVCKLLEHIICKHMMDHLETNNILTSLNHGFRSGHSTETQLLTTVHDLVTANDKRKQTDVAILDFSKAFDTVPHNKLLHKLTSYGIKGPIHR